MEKTMDKIVALAKSRGFVYPGSEIYGGLANTWDYGNLGVELKNNVKKAWWQKFVQESPYNVGVDCAILMNSQTWVASGHLGGCAVDVFPKEPCTDSVLTRYSNALLTPHSATSTAENSKATNFAAANNLVNYLKKDIDAKYVVVQGTRY